MNLQELGELLRTERQRKGLSVEEVAEKTKISIANINAIEEGRKDSLPHPVYAKGFVKNYAKLLDLDPTEMSSVMNREYGVEEDDFGESPAMENPVNMPARPASEKRFKWPTILVLLILLAVLGGLIWQMSNTPDAPQPVAPATGEPPLAEEALPEPVTPAEPVEPLEPTEPEPPAPEAVQPEEPAGLPNATAPETDLDEALVEAKPPEPEQPSEPEAATGEEAVQEQAEPETPAATEPAVAGTGMQSVVITAQELCWVYGQIDNATVTDFTLRPGQSRSIGFDENLRLKLGNAGGVDITFNGREYPLEAESGEVRTLVFP